MLSMRGAVPLLWCGHGYIYTLADRGGYLNFRAWLIERTYYLNRKI
jgi:hypothetical protein